MKLEYHICVTLRTMSANHMPRYIAELMHGHFRYSEMLRTYYCRNASVGSPPSTSVMQRMRTNFVQMQRTVESPQSGHLGSQFRRAHRATYRSGIRGHRERSRGQPAP